MTGVPIYGAGGQSTVSKAFAVAFHGLVALTGTLYVAMAVHFLYDVIAGLTYGRLAREYGLPNEPPMPNPDLTIDSPAQTLS